MLGAFLFWTSDLDDIPHSPSTLNIGERISRDPEEYFPSTLLFSSANPHAWVKVFESSPVDNLSKVCKFTTLAFKLEHGGNCFRSLALV